MAKDIGILALLVSASFWKLVFSRRYTFLESPDIANQVLPWLQLQAVALRQGLIALWDPYSLGGQPLVGQLQPGVTSPLVYLLLALPLKDGRLDPAMVHLWFAALHLVCAVFTYLLLRDLALGRAACILGAYFFAIGGYVGNAQWPQYVTGAAWLPLIALFLRRALLGMNATANAAMAGAFLGVCWLSGHHQLPYFTSLAVGIAMLAAAARSRGARVMVNTAVPLFAIAACVAAVQVIPALEYGRLSVRWVGAGDPIGWDTRVPYQVHLDHALALKDLVYVIFPGGEHTIANPVVGIVALTLALAGALRAKPFLWLALGSLAFALAGVNPLHRLLYELLPGLDKARAPAAALGLTHFAVSVLAAYGVAQLPQLAAGRARWWLAAFGVATLAAVAWIRPSQPAAATVAAIAIAFAALLFLSARVAAVARLCPAALAILLWAEHSLSSGEHYRDRQDQSRLAVLPGLTGGTSGIAAFLAQAPPGTRAEIHYEDVLFNFGLWHGVETLSGYLPGVLTANYRLGWWDATVLSLYGVRYTVARAPVRDGQREVFSGDSATGSQLKVFENPLPPLPRAWAVHTVRQVKDAATEVRAGQVAFKREAVVEPGSGAPVSLAPCEQSAESRVAVIAHGLHHVMIDATLACAGMVVLADNYFPGWQATIDGVAAPIVPVNAALRGVSMEKGRHRLEMRYRPWSVYAGLALTGCGLLAAAAIYYFFALKRSSTTFQFTAPHQAFR